MQPLLLVAILILFVIIEKKIYEKNWDKNIDIDISFSKDMASEDENIKLKTSVVNGKRLAVPSLSLKFATDRNLVAPSLLLNEKTSVTDSFYYTDMLPAMPYKIVEHEFICYAKKRGKYKIDEVFVGGRDILYSGTYHERFSVDASVLIYPKHVAMGKKELPFHNLIGEILTKFLFLEDPFSFRGLRDYQPEDTMRKINWKASARTGEYLVNEFNQSVARSVSVIFNAKLPSTFFDEDLFEEGLRLAVSVAADLLEEGFNVSFVSNAYIDDTLDEAYVYSGSYESHLELIHRQAALINGKAELPSFDASGAYEKLLESGDFVVLISSDQSESIVNAIHQRNDEGKETFLIVPTTNRIVFRPDMLFNIEAREWNIYES